MHPRQHVIDVALGVMRVDFNRPGHATWAAPCERRDEALEQGVVAGGGHLFCTVLEQDGPLSQRLDGGVQHGVHLGGVILPDVPALALDPPGGRGRGGVAKSEQC